MNLRFQTRKVKFAEIFLSTFQVDTQHSSKQLGAKLVYFMVLKRFKTTALTFNIFNI